MVRRRGVMHEPGAAAPAADLGVAVPDAVPDAVNDEAKTPEPDLKAVDGGADASKESKEVR